MTQRLSASTQWKEYYASLSKTNNFYPENFVTRVFLSKSPVEFLNDNYIGKTILDLGCGHGRSIPFLVNNGFAVTGLEVSEEQVNLLETRFPEQHFLMGVANNIPASDKHFDYVLACNSIYYLDQDQTTLHDNFAEVARVLKADGRFVFSLLGHQHSIFDGSVELPNHVFKIKHDFLGFRQECRVQIFNHELINNELAKFTILHHGELLETVAGTTRHIHYFVASLKL
ncbi:class I SAM-dependent methyltransferase [Psychrosphaera aquimarina]|uniref:Class I SAM-dependent methyltransferase n=1 Tax=Psychrosphaera aquimarina TaxID=2044854 RepID=A0ABU3QZE8_9GAMM|nr:class I SAM-dependent methyltransferase [Psychrosphaera aquimarina]MDU0112800.1 class I SAM-dependent methyltransferase [Psychrosphaera aquimarina]